MIVLLFAGSVFTSCKKNTTEPPSGCDTCTDTTHHICDTCNLNKDSLQRVRDSLAHAFVWTEYSIPGETNLTGVWVFGEKEILIIGNNIWKYNGTSFTQVHTLYNLKHTSLDNGWNGFNIFALSDREFWSVQGGQARYTPEGQGFDFYNFPTLNACWGVSN